MSDRSQINAHLRREVKDKLVQIRNHHFGNGAADMSMTRILETLIEREHKRLKLCSDTNPPSQS